MKDTDGLVRKTKSKKSVTKIRADGGIRNYLLAGSMLDYLIDHPASVSTDMELPLWASQVEHRISTYRTYSTYLSTVQCTGIIVRVGTPYLQ